MLNIFSKIFLVRTPILSSMKQTVIMTVSSTCLTLGNSWTAFCFILEMRNSCACLVCWE